VSRHYGNQKLFDFTSPLAAPPRLHAAVLADRLHPAAGDVEHTFNVVLSAENIIWSIGTGPLHPAVDIQPGPHPSVTSEAAPIHM